MPRKTAAQQAAAALEHKYFQWIPWSAARPWDKNPRQNERAVDPVARSIVRWGFIRPITIWPSANRMVAGHTALKAMERILLHGYRGVDGKKIPPQPQFTPRDAPGPGMVPVRFHEFDSEEEANAYALADNKLGEIADWDELLLAEQLAAQQKADALLPQFAGFTKQEVDRLLAAARGGSAQGDDDEVDPTAELLAKWQPQLGMIWEVPSLALPGRSHRIACGDSETPELVKRLHGGTNVVLVVTDPPYGVNYDPKWRDDINRGTTRLSGTVANDDRADWQRVFELWNSDVLYVYHADRYIVEVGLSLDRASYQRRAQLMWKKQLFVLSRAHYHWQHEPIWYAVKKGRRSGWNGDRTQSTVWDIANLNPRGGGAQGDDDPVGHGTQKPVECMARPMRNHFEEGAIVGDPFLGSGSTLVAAERTGRVCLGMDLDPKWIAVALERCTKIGLQPVVVQ